MIFCVILLNDFNLNVNYRKQVSDMPLLFNFLMSNNTLLLINNLWFIDVEYIIDILSLNYISLLFNNLLSTIEERQFNVIHCFSFQLLNLS